MVLGVAIGVVRPFLALSVMLNAPDGVVAGMIRSLCACFVCCSWCGWWSVVW